MNREVHVRFCERFRGVTPLYLLDYPNQAVSLKVNNAIYTTYTDFKGIYRFYLYQENTEYQITLPTMGTDVTTANRQLLVQVGSTAKDYPNNDFVLKPRFINSLLVKTTQKRGAWAFERANFDNVYTTAIGNLSLNKTFNNIDLTYVFKNADGNSTSIIPDIEEIKVYKLESLIANSLINFINIDLISNQWVVQLPVETYNQTELLI